MFLFCNSCGLAVLAMATRTLRACEIAVGGAANGGSDNPFGMENTHRMDILVQKSLERGREIELSIDPYVHPIDSPPTLADIQKQAVSLGLSGRGEIFSATALACVADGYQKGRYSVKMVKRNLLNDAEQKNIETFSDEDIDTNYEMYNDNNEQCENKTKEINVNKITPSKQNEMVNQHYYDCNPLLFNERILVEFCGDDKNEDCTSPKEVSNIKVKTISTNYEHHDHQMPQYYNSNLPSFDHFNPASSYNFKKHGDLLIADPSGTAATMSVVQHLMRGHLIAVW